MPKQYKNKTAKQAMTLPQCLTTEISTISYEFRRLAMKVSKRGKTSTPAKETENERTHSKRRDGSDERVTKEGSIA